MKVLCKKIGFQVWILLQVTTMGMLFGACADSKENIRVEIETNIREENPILNSGENVAIEEKLDPDDFSQAVHYSGYLDESPYTHWIAPTWKDCDFDGDGMRDRVHREINDSETEITYKIDFGNGEMLEVARTGDYFMWPKIKSANICGDENKEILFVGEHSLATSPAADVTLFEKTESGYEEIPLLHPIEWFGNLDGAVYLYANDEPVLDMMGPTADFVEQFDWNLWCENEAWEQLHFGTYEESGRTAVDADFIKYGGSLYLILYHNMGDKWLYKEIGFVFQVGEYKESGAERELILEKIVADGDNLPLEIDISEHYITNIGDPSNLYYIDENKVLWGCGQNQYGQLGQGGKDADFHEEMVKIAEDVIHVDYSQKGFVIYITEDKKLYGFGNGASGILYQFASYSSDVFYSYDEYAVTTPKLLFEDVEYARCGRSDITVMKTDKSVWIWGVIWCRNANTVCYQGWPIKVLDEAVFITGNDFNHAALLQDGSVWTWGYNYSGNCGIEAMPEVSTPQKVAEDAVMVWTGNIDGKIDCKNISDFEGEYPRDMENTIIQKNDGSYWICGANVGDTKHTIPHYYEGMDYEMVCSYQFVPYENSLYF